MFYLVLEPFCDRGMDVAIGRVIKLNAQEAPAKVRLGFVRPATEEEAKKFNAGRDAADRTRAVREAERVSLELRRDEESRLDDARKASGAQA